MVNLRLVSFPADDIDIIKVTEFMISTKPILNGEWNEELKGNFILLVEYMESFDGYRSFAIETIQLKERQDLKYNQGVIKN